MRYERLEKIKEGTILAIPIIGDNNTIILKAGTILNSEELVAIKNVGCDGAFIHDTLSKDIVLRENISLEDKIEAASVCGSIDYDKYLYLSHMLSDKIMDSSINIYTSMSMISSYDTYTYIHSVNVAIYAGIMGVILGLSEDKIEKLVLTGLLHDIGKTNIPESLINKPSKLTSKEFDIVKKHPEIGYNILKNTVDIPATVRISVLEHHENYDGTGYPNGLKGNDIYLFAKIIHICDVYDAMVTRRTYKEALNPCSVIEFLMSQSGKMFDPGLVITFIKNIVPYPEGVMVLLSDGTEAIIKENNPEYPMRPKVIDVANEREIDLMHVFSLTIIKILT